MSSPDTMIRNRSQMLMTSSPTTSDIESNIHSDGKGSHRTTGGAKYWKWLLGIGAFALVLYFLVWCSYPAPLEEHKSSNAASYEQLTVVMNTFKRHDLMLGTNIIYRYVSHVG